MDEQQILNDALLNSKTYEEFGKKIKGYNFSKPTLNQGLIYAIINNKHYDIINTLLVKGANVNYNDGEPLLTATSNFTPYYNLQETNLTIYELLNRGADPNVRNGQAMINLINRYPTIDKRYIAMEVSRLLEYDYNASINDNEAVIEAAEKELWDIVRLLVYNGADIHARNGRALHMIEKMNKNNSNYAAIIDADKLSQNRAKSVVRSSSPVRVPSPVKTTTFNLENVYSYSEKYMDDWLATFGLKYDSLAKKRYMTISKLIEHNLFDDQDAFLIRKHMNNFLSLLEQYPNSTATLRQYLH